MPLPMLLLFFLLWFPSSVMAESPPHTIVAFGDSLTAGYRIALTDAFPARLEEALKAKKHKVTVINAGVSGDTTAGGVARIDAVLAHKPAIVIVELGANDALRGLPPEQAREHLDIILTKLTHSGAKVILAGMKAPINLGPEYAQAFNPIYPELAKKHKAALYPFFLEGVAFNQTLNLPDGLHPNADGVKEIVKRLLPEVEKALDDL